MVNWVVSVILVAFAIWSIQLNAQGRGMLKESTAVVASIDTKIESLTQQVKQTEEACKAPIVVPTTTTDTQTEQ